MKNVTNEHALAGWEASEKQLKDTNATPRCTRPFHQRTCGE